MKFAPGDYVKFEIKDEKGSQSEWMWLRVDRSDDSRRLIFGCLDNESVLFASRVKLGQQMVISYENVRDHKKSD